jgi:methionine-rich copper-binding protein CopC
MKTMTRATTTKNKMRIILIIILCLAANSLAKAHAFLDHADPRVGSTVHNSPPKVTLWFTEELEPAFSKIRVLNAAGGEVDKKDVHVDAAQKVVMSVTLPPLPPGSYKVIWSAVAVDTHHTTGTFTFTVAP